MIVPFIVGFILGIAAVLIKQDFDKVGSEQPSTSNTSSGDSGDGNTNNNLNQN